MLVKHPVDTYPKFSFQAMCCFGYQNQKAGGVESLTLQKIRTGEVNSSLDNFQALYHMMGKFAIDDSLDQWNLPLY